MAIQLFAAQNILLIKPTSVWHFINGCSLFVDEY